MYINPKHIILAMGIIIFLMMMYIIYLLRHPVSNNNQPVIIMNPGNNQPASIPFQQQKQIVPSCTIAGSQSDFFKKSMKFAIDYLSGQGMIDINSLPMDSQQVLSSVNMLSSEVKNNIITAINYLSIDASNASSNEDRLRTMSVETRSPLWIVMIREAAVKVIPNFNLMNDNNFNPNFVAQPSNLTIVKK